MSVVVPTFDEFNSSDSFNPTLDNTSDDTKSSIPTFEDFSKIDSPSPKIKKQLLDSSSLEASTKNYEVSGLVRSGYGLRKAPIKGASTFHPAIDIHANLGDSVKPADAGEVIAVGKRGGLGLSITIKHSDGRETIYNHLSRINVEKGDKVTKEAIIGQVGSTGISTGPHLDFRVRVNGKYVDPFTQLDSDPRTEGTNLRLKAWNNVNVSTTNIPTFDNFNKSILPTYEEAQVREITKNQISVTGADIIHHLGFDPTKIEDLNPSLKSHIISIVNKAVENDRVKRENGQTEFPIDINYQNSMRKKVGLPQMNSIMQQYRSSSQNNIDNEAISFSNHTAFPIIYNIASTVAPETQEVHRNNLIENNLEDLRHKNRTIQGTNLFGFTRPVGEVNEDILREEAEKLTDQQLAIEEQQHLDAISKTATFTKNIISNDKLKYLAPFVSPLLFNQDTRRGLAETIGSNAKILGDWSAVLYPTEITPDIQRLGREVTIGGELNRQENTIDPLSYSQNLRRGIGEGIGRSPELIKLFAGAELLGPELAAANLPIQGAISSVSEGPKGMLKGALNGIIYHYGGAITGPYLGKINNSLLWIAAPAAEAHLIGGQDLAEAIGSNIPMGLFVGLTGGERAKVIDGKTIRSANLTDIPKIQSGELNFVPPSYRVGFEKGKVIEELARRFNSVPLNIEVPKSNYSIPIPTAEANLRLLDLKRELIENNNKEVTEETTNNSNKIQASIDVLEKGIPEDVKKFYSENEDAIRAGINTEIARKDKLEKQPIFKNGKLREDVGAQNNWGTSASKAEEILNNFTKIGTNRLKVNLPFAPGADILASKVADLSYLTAFFIEDFYHRGIKPTISLVRNRLSESLGDFGKHLKDDTLKEAFDKGLDYFKSNNVDTFFSRMKQDASEKLPNRFDSQQARNILKQHENEFEWISGLDEFLKTNEGKKISKNELIDVIQKGQVRVEVSVASEEKSAKELELEQQIDLMHSKDMFYEPELNQLKHELQLLMKNRPKYSLKTYGTLVGGEKLELPGAVNSKEVKLISPILHEDDINAVKYRAPHWDEPNIIAHYRSNDRTTTDNIPIHFSEEFQSDWNHDIRKKGLKLTTEQRIDEKLRLEKLIREQKDKDIETERLIGQIPFNEELDLLRIQLDMLDHNISNKVEPNPFMQHAWKELVFKRFLRDAVTAKDENGNNKYDGIGWTTAKQQKERYGKLLEGKDFRWNKNNDGTYTFHMKQIESNGLTHDYGVFHELDHITLERFAELTTKEAAEEVNQQEKQFHNDPENSSFKVRLAKSIGKRFDIPINNPSGKFSLKEVVELRSNSGKYSDYDVAMVNYAKKIGKRFGAKYELKELNLQDKDDSNLLDKQLLSSSDWTSHNENIHFLEITPSMRESLSKEGFALYGLGGSEKLKSQEIGTRNSIVSNEAFDQHRNDLVKSLEEQSTLGNVFKDDSISEITKGTVFNSGLSPDAFIDQTKLLYKGIREFSDFSKQLITRFGESISPFIQDLWIQTKDLVKNFNSEDYKKGYSGTYNMGLDLSKIDPRNLGLTKKKAANEYLTNPEKHQGKISDYRFITSATGLAQFEPKFGEVYNNLVAGQRATNGFNSFILNSFREANRFLKTENHDQVGQVVYNGLVEEGKVFSRAELLTGNFAAGRPALNTKQADAYENFYRAQHLSLDLRKDTILYNIRERLNRVNNQLALATLGTPEYADLILKKTAISSHIKDVDNYYSKLKSSGYFSLQREGSIAAFIESSNGEKIYRQFEKRPIRELAYRSNTREAQNWIDEQIAKGANANTQSIYDLRKTEELSGLSKKLSIGAFEDLIDSSGVNSNSPEIEKLRDEVYSRFASTGYQLKRDFTLGYDRTWESAVASVIRQAERYSSSFYSRVSKEEALKTLSNTDLQKTDPNLYQLSKAYIEDETVSPETGILGNKPALVEGLGKARQAVYVVKLGYDFSQLYLNAIFQPITQNYSYLARVRHPDLPDLRLKGTEPEQYFGKGIALSLKLAKDYFTKTNQSPRFVEFKDIYDRLVDERIVEPEFSKSLLELETDTLGKDITQTTLQKALSVQQHLHWSGVFMRAGEKVTRTHMAATLFEIGKDKFNLNGDKLTDFIVQGIHATQSNPTRGDNPYLLRRALGASSASSEAGKLVGQFNKFNQMWVENLALNIKSDFERTWDTKNLKDLPANVAKDFINNKARATTRMLYPLLIIGGLKGLPLAGLAFSLYTLLSGNDPKDKFDKAFKNHKTLESMALYGITGNAGFSGKVTPNVPFVDTLFTDKSTIPLYSASEQILKGLYNLSPLTKEKTDEKGIEELVPSSISRLLKARRYSTQGIPIGKTKRKATRSEIIGQGIGITPSRIVSYYDQQRTKHIQEIHRKLFK